MLSYGNPGALYLHEQEVNVAPLKLIKSGSINPKSMSRNMYHWHKQLEKIFENSNSVANLVKKLVNFVELTIWSGVPDNLDDGMRAVFEAVKTNYTDKKGTRILYDNLLALGRAQRKNKAKTISQLWASENKIKSAISDL